MADLQKKHPAQSQNYKKKSDFLSQIMVNIQKAQAAVTPKTQEQQAVLNQAVQETPPAETNPTGDFLDPEVTNIAKILQNLKKSNPKDYESQKRQIEGLFAHFQSTAKPAAK